MRRYIITGAPGAGKTTIVAGLRALGYATVDEAATDVIAREQARGVEEPWACAVGDNSFIDAIARLQREREHAPVPLATAVQVFDRSPICTLALAHYSDRPVSPFLAGEVDRVVRAGVFERRVFMVRLLGFITPTAARRITLPQSIRFEQFHEQAYLAHGFTLVDVPAAPLSTRVRLVDHHLRADPPPR
jgi:predicted ATPase